MTSLDKIEPASVAPSAPAMTGGHHLAAELGETLKLAVPIALTQLGQIAMMTTDIALIGRFGTEAVAAASLAHTVFFVCFTFGMGLVSAVAPLAAQAFGARNPHGVRRSLRVGLWAALLMALPMMALSFRGEPILLALGQSPGAARLAQEYLLGLTWSILPALCFLAIRGFMSAVNRPEPILWITLSAIPANAMLVYLLLTARSACRTSGCSARGSRPRSSISAPSWRGCGLPRAGVRSGNFTCSDISGASTGS
jgi:MATE family multidrug resistance protein